MLVLHHLKPLDQVFGALQSGVQAVFLTFETGHILHGDAEQRRGQEKKRKKKGAWGWVKKKKRRRGEENRHVLSHHPQTEHFLYIGFLLGLYMARGQSGSVIMSSEIIMTCSCKVATRGLSVVKSAFAL